MKRLKAVQLCEDRGFQVGQLLSSKEWKRPRVLVSIGARDVVYRCGTQMDVMTTMPNDTHVMRDPARIRVILDALHTYWEQNPELRLGQILGNAAGDKSFFFMEDEALLEWLRNGGNLA